MVSWIPACAGMTRRQGDDGGKGGDDGGKGGDDGGKGGDDEGSAGMMRGWAARGMMDAKGCAIPGYLRSLSSGMPPVKRWVSKS